MTNLHTIKFEPIFSEAFDTFKVFKSLSVVTVTCMPPGTSKNIWQILNHLILWQENELLLAEGKKTDKHISEIDTWIKTEVPNEQSDIDSAVRIFDNQISKIKTIASTLSLSELDFELKFRKILDMATHLSFHLGEIVLLRRQCGNYPTPEDMQAFLEND